MHVHIYRSSCLFYLDNTKYWVFNIFVCEALQVSLEGYCTSSDAKPCDLIKSNKLPHLCHEFTVSGDYF